MLSFNFFAAFSIHLSDVGVCSVGYNIKPGFWAVRVLSSCICILQMVLQQAHVYIHVYACSRYKRHSSSTLYAYL